MKRNIVVANWVLSMILAFVFIGCGCVFTHNLMLKQEAVATYPSQDKIDMHVELRLPLELLDYIWKYRLDDTTSGNNYRVALGNIISEKAENLTKYVFRDVSITRDDVTPAVRSNADVFLTINIDYIRVNASNEVESFPIRSVPVALGLEWTLKNRRNEIIWIETIEGVGLTVKGILTHEKIIAAAKKCIDDLFRTSFDSIMTSSEIRKFAITQHEQKRKSP